MQEPNKDIDEPPSPTSRPPNNLNSDEGITPTKTKEVSSPLRRIEIAERQPAESI